MNNPLFISYPGVVCAAGSGRDALWNAVTSGKQDFIKKVSAAGKEFFAARIDEDEVGCLHLIRAHVTDGRKLPRHALGVGDIHLTTINQ